MLMVEAVEATAQALAFTRTRQAAELIHRYVREELRSAPFAAWPMQVRAYRGGYLPNERRADRAGLCSPAGCAASRRPTRWSWGIDIGSLDVALLANYPGTIASTWQQAGRSGRRHDESLAVLLAGNDPVDQYLLRHPDYFFRQSPEHAVVDPDNPYVLAKHLKAAAFELPLDDDDLRALRSVWRAPIAEALGDDGRAGRSGRPLLSTPAAQNPAVGVSLRHMSDNTFSIVLRRARRRSGRRRAIRAHSDAHDDFEVIANVDAISAPELVYPEAVYLHNGESYFVRELDLEGKVAYVERHEMDYYTQAVLESSVKITRPSDERARRCRSAVAGLWRRRRHAGRRWRSRRSNSARARTSA